jgi:hypothetical protein
MTKKNYGRIHPLSVWRYILEDFEKVFDSMEENWGSTIVARKVIHRFTGGVLSPKTLGNEDAKGTGPKNRFILMNQVVYPLDSLVAWLKSRVAYSWKERNLGLYNDSKQ